MSRLAVAEADALPFSALTPAIQAQLKNTFHLAVVAAHRVKQLAAGARPRLDPGIHRHTRIAVLEVAAGLVSWTVVLPPTAEERVAPTK
jgi:DNA-directed RNA polymerase subunit K/omega